MGIKPAAALEEDAAVADVAEVPGGEPSLVGLGTKE